MLASRILKIIPTRIGSPPLNIKVLSQRNLHNHQIDGVVQGVTNPDQIQCLKQIQQKYPDVSDIFVAHGNGDPADSLGLGWRYQDEQGTPHLVYNAIHAETGGKPALALICDDVIKGSSSDPIKTAKVVFPQEKTYSLASQAVIKEPGALRLEWMAPDSQKFLDHLTSHKLTLDKDGKLRKIK